MTRRDEPSDVLVLPRALVQQATDSLLFGELVRLYELADGSYPHPAAMPRWADDKVVQQLAKAGAVELHDGDRYTVAAVEWNRKRQMRWQQAGGKARAEQAARGAGGQFTSQQDQQEPAGAGATTSSTSRDQQVLATAGAPSVGGHQQGPALPAGAGEPPAGGGVGVGVGVGKVYSSAKNESGAHAPSGAEPGAAVDLGSNDGPYSYSDGRLARGGH